MSIESSDFYGPGKGLDGLLSDAFHSFKEHVSGMVNGAGEIAMSAVSLVTGGVLGHACNHLSGVFSPQDDIPADVVSNVHGADVKSMSGKFSESTIAEIMGQRDTLQGAHMSMAGTHDLSVPTGLPANQPRQEVEPLLPARHSA